MTSPREQQLDNIYEGLFRAEMVMRNFVEREQNPALKTRLSEHLAFVSKARESHSQLADELA